MYEERGRDKEYINKVMYSIIQCHVYTDCHVYVHGITCICVCV